MTIYGDAESREILREIPREIPYNFLDDDVPNFILQIKLKWSSDWIERTGSHSKCP